MKETAFLWDKHAGNMKREQFAGLERMKRGVRPAYRVHWEQCF
jgi:hypothetical protein